MKSMKVILVAMMLALPLTCLAEVKQFTFSTTPTQSVSVVIREEPGRTYVMQKDSDTGVYYWLEMPNYNPGDLKLPYPNQPKQKK